MNYIIIFTNRAIKDLKGIDNKIKKRIGNKLKIYSENPLKYGKKLTDPKIGTYKFKIGDYRVIFDIDENKIIILRLGHRKNIYKG